MQVSLMVIDCKNKTAPYAPDGIRLIRTTNIRHGKLNDKEPKFVTERDLRSMEPCEENRKPVIY